MLKKWKRIHRITIVHLTTNLLDDATNANKYLTILQPRARFLLAEVRGVRFNCIYDVTIPLAGKERVFYSLLTPVLYLEINITDYDSDH